MKAIVELKGHQYIVEENTIIDIEKFDTSNDKEDLTKVLMIINDGKVTIGTPYVKDASIDVEILEHLKAPKEIVFKFKRKTGYKKKQGHRQQQSRLRVNKIHLKKKTKTKESSEKTATKEDK